VSRKLLHAGEPFLSMHRDTTRNALAKVPWEALHRHGLERPRLEEVANAWSYRVQTEFRSIQVMTRFTTEVVGAGDPLEVYSAVSSAITDEVRHTALCAAVVEALGFTPFLPEPLVEAEAPGFLALPMAQRALGTAVSMLCISETISVALIEDLRARCRHPALSMVLALTLEDEDEHRDFGWAYVQASLARFASDDARAFAQTVAEVTLEPHIRRSMEVLGDKPMSGRELEALTEPEEAEWGLLSQRREALLKLEVIERVVVPRLEALGISPHG
jgi:hypothetical protein